MKKYVTCALFVLLMLLQTARQDDGAENDAVFVPTKEWQIVKKGQKIPKGLHVRINFETGLTEAKLLDDKEKENKLNAVTVALDDIGKIQSHKTDGAKFRTYQELKDDLEEVDLLIKTDAEIIAKLTTDFASASTDEAVLKILDELEYLAHQYDNALEFVRRDGFRTLVYRTLNATDAGVRSRTLLLFGSLVQNNPKVQIHALETGAVGILHRSLGDKNREVRSRTVYALSGLLRRFPWAQLKFAEHGGLVTLVDEVKGDDVKTGVKIATLLTDLVVEHRMVVEFGESAKVAQYANVDVKRRLVDAGYCEAVNGLFVKAMIVDKDDLDAVHRCLSAMSEVATGCKHAYTENLRKMLKRLLKDYRERKDEDLADSITAVEHILEKTAPKDEL